MVRLCVDGSEERSVCCGRGRGGAREALLGGCLRAWKRIDPRERSNSTREWNGLEQAIDDVSHAEQVVGVRRTTQPREERRAALM